MEIARTKSELLQSRIIQNKYLLYKLAERNLYSREALSISEGTLERARINLYMDVRKCMHFSNTQLFDSPLKSILGEDEKYALNAASICSYYDPTAFVETMAAAVNDFDPSRGPFMVWFRLKYRQIASKRISKEIYNHKLSPKASITLKKIDDYLHSIGESPESLSDIAKEELAAQYGWSKNQLQSAWRIRELQKMCSLDTQPSDETNSDTLSYTIEDNGFIRDILTKERLDDLHRLLKIINTPDNKIYTKLFWSNLILHPFKDKLEGKEALYAPSPEECLELYRNLEVELMDLFDLRYLIHCLKVPPNPDSIDHINECESLHPFISKTIAEYMTVSAAYVSQKMKEFRQLQAELRKRYSDMY